MFKANLNIVNNNLIVLTFYAISINLLAQFVYAMEAITYSAETKAHASMGIITSTHAPATLYNPANIAVKNITNRYEFYYDQNLAYIRLVYEHPLYEPLVYNLVVPPMSAGIVFRILNDLNLALVFAPVGSGGTSKINKLPLDIMDNSTDIFDIRISRLATKTGLGLKYSIQPNLYIGVSLIHLYDREQLKVYERNGSSDPLVRSFLSGHFIQNILGLVYSNLLYDFKVGLLYSPAIVKKYSNAVNVIAGGELVKVPAAQYIAQTFGLGIAKNFSKSFGVYLEYSTELYSKGKKIAKRGFGFDPPQTDLIDTRNFSISGFKKFSNGNKFILGIGHYPAYIGNGRYADPNIADDKGVMGVRFGDFQALGYVRFGAGYEFIYKQDKSFLISFSYTHGTRMVPREHPGQGRYKMHFTFVGIRGIF